MLKRFSTNFAIFSIAMDAFVISFLLWFVGRIRPFLGDVLEKLPFIKDVNHPLNLPLALYLLFPVIWVIIMQFFSVYDGSKNIRVVDEFTSLTISTILAGVTLAGVLYLSYREISRVFFIVFVLLTYLLLLVWRVIARTLYWMRNVRTENVRRVLIIGAGVVGRDVAERLSAYSHLGPHLVGYLDDDPAKRSDHVEILGSISDVREIVNKFRVDTVVIALPLRAYERVNRIASDTEDLPVKLWIIPDYFQMVLHHAGLDDFVGIPMLDMRAPALTENQRLVKRIFDVVIATLAFIPALPVMGLIALIVLIDDGPPVIFKQKRIGENGRMFYFYKFRTMFKNAEQLQSQVQQLDEQGHVVYKRPDDPRITRTGHFLRKFSLDEIPQLINILMGTMSWVGPRPELPELVEKYQSWQRRRFAIPQGLTGWWQINGRSDKPMHLHTEEDLYYIQNYSIWLDIQILFKTVWIVIRGKGAY